MVRWKHEIHLRKTKLSIAQHLVNMQMRLRSSARTARLRSRAAGNAPPRSIPGKSQSSISPLSTPKCLSTAASRSIPSIDNDDESVSTSSVSSTHPTDNHSLKKDDNYEEKEKVASADEPPIVPLAVDGDHDDDEETVLVKVRKKRDPNIFKDPVAFVSPSLGTTQFDPKDKDTVLWELAKQEWGGNIFSGTKWTEKGWTQRPKLNQRRKAVYCHYQYLI